MSTKRPGDSSMMKVHAAGAAACLIVAAGSIWFATHTVSKRRGLFLSARHQLTTTKAELNETVARRSAIATQVQRLERLTSKELDLVSVRGINTRTAEIARIAENNGVRVDSLQPLSMISDARVPVQPLELLGGTEADSVSDLLDELERQMPDMHIQAIELTNEALGSDQVRIRIMLYWFVDPVEDS